MNLNAEVLSITNVSADSRAGFDGALLDAAIRSDDGGLDGLIIKKLAGFQPIFEIKSTGILLVVCSDNLECTVDFVERSGQMFFESTSEICRVLDSPSLCFSAFSSKMKADTRPKQNDEGYAEQGRASPDG